VLLTCAFGAPPSKHSLLPFSPSMLKRSANFGLKLVAPGLYGHWSLSSGLSIMALHIFRVALQHSLSSRRRVDSMMAPLHVFFGIAIAFAVQHGFSPPRQSAGFSLRASKCPTRPHDRHLGFAFIPRRRAQPATSVDPADAQSFA
jgi:hypothetical protein